MKRSQAERTAGSAKGIAQVAIIHRRFGHRLTFHPAVYKYTCVLQYKKVLHTCHLCLRHSAIALEGQARPRSGSWDDRLVTVTNRRKPGCPHREYDAFLVERASDPQDARVHAERVHLPSVHTYRASQSHVHICLYAYRASAVYVSVFDELARHLQQNHVQVTEL